MITKHWKDTWSRFASDKERDEKVEKAKSFFKDVFKHVRKERDWQRPSDKDFCKKAAKAKGAGGPDGWTSEEV